MNLVQSREAKLILTHFCNSVRFYCDHPLEAGKPFERKTYSYPS